MGQPSQRMQQRRHEVLEFHRELLERLLVDQGQSPTEALVIASDFTDQYAQHVAGQTICYPKEHRYRLLRKELEIYNKFDGNVPELAIQYDMTERGMYKLIARVRKRLRENAQPGLFDDCLSAA